MNRVGLFTFGIIEGEIEMTKRNTTRDFGTSKWKEDFYKQDSLTSVIDSTDIEDYEFHRIEKTYTVNDDRVGAIVQIKQNDRMLRVIIDFRMGFATCDQIMDVKFNIGTDCDYFIIIYEDSRKFEDQMEYWDDVLDAQCFLEVLVAYQVKAYLVRANNALVDKGPIGYQYHCTSSGGIYSSDSFSKKLPSKRRFQHAEFMTYHFGIDSHYNTHVMFRPAEWCFGSETNLQMGGICINKELDLFSNWTDRGFFMNAVPESEEGIRMLEWIWENKREQLRKEYNDSTNRASINGLKLKMYKKDGRPAKLSIRLSPRPFLEIAYLVDCEKRNYGEMVYCEESFFGDLIDELINDMPVMKIAVNS
jgi:hypothetical protein